MYVHQETIELSTYITCVQYVWDLQSNNYGWMLIKWFVKQSLHLYESTFFNLTHTI